MHIGNAIWHIAKTYLCSSSYSATKLGTGSAWHRPFCQNLVAAKNEKAKAALLGANAQIPAIEARLATMNSAEKLVIRKIENQDKVGLQLLRKQNPAYEAAYITVSAAHLPSKLHLARLESQIPKLEASCQRYGSYLAELARMQRS